MAASASFPKALTRIILTASLAVGAFALAGCSSNHPIVNSNEQCASCHSDGRTSVDGVGKASATETGLTFGVESSASEVYLCTASVAENGTVIPARERTLSSGELSSVTVNAPGLYALCEGAVSSPSKIVLIEAIESGPANATVKL